MDLQQDETASNSSLTSKSLNTSETSTLKQTEGLKTLLSNMEINEDERNNQYAGDKRKNKEIPSENKKSIELFKNNDEQEVSFIFFKNPNEN